MIGVTRSGFTATIGPMSNIETRCNTNTGKYRATNTNSIGNLCEKFSSYLTNSVENLLRYIFSSEYRVKFDIENETFPSFLAFRGKFHEKRLSENHLQYFS